MSRFGKTHSTEDLIQPGYSPPMFIAGRQMGKTEMMRKIVEDMEKATAKAIFGTTTVSNTTTPPITLASIEAVMKGLKFKQLDKGQTMPNDITDKNTVAVALSVKLNDGFKVSPPTTPFQLTGPVSASIKERNGAYKTKAFLGDEAFNPTTSYVGKKGDIIVVFKASVPTQYAFMEMPLNKAVDQLKGFGLHVDTLSGGSVQAVMNSFNEAVVATQAAEKQGLMDNPEFASW